MYPTWLALAACGTNPEPVAPTPVAPVAPTPVAQTRPTPPPKPPPADPPEPSDPLAALPDAWVEVEMVDGTLHRSPGDCTGRPSKLRIETDPLQIALALGQEDVTLPITSGHWDGDVLRIEGPVPSTSSQPISGTFVWADAGKTRGTWTLGGIRALDLAPAEHAANLPEIPLDCSDFEP